MNLKKSVYLVLACGFTAALFYYLAKTTTLADWVSLYKGLDYQYFAAYVVLFLLSMFLKAVRYQVLLRASGATAPPGLCDLLTITFASNLFVDLLPARSGSLAYIVFLNRKLEVELPACASSFAFSFIFDLIGMLPLFFLAIISHSLTDGGGGYHLWALLGVLTLISLAVLTFLQNVLNWAAAVIEFFRTDSPGKINALASRLSAEVRRMASDVVKVKGKKVFMRVLLLSVAIKLGKYLSLYLLLMGIAGQWADAAAKLSFHVVLFALVAAEATASLPVSGIAGFGAYEGVMTATLRQAGLSAGQAAMTPFGLHLTTQTLDYFLGGLALLYLSLSTRSKHGPRPEKLET